MELLDIVDEQDNVIGVSTFDDIYKNKHPHRIVHVLLFDHRGDMAMQLRSAKKPFCPLHWSTAVGGHVMSGETYEQAAKREFMEELGAEYRLAFFRKDRYVTQDGIVKHLTTFSANYDGPFNINKEEVERIDFFTSGEIKGMMANGEKFHPELAFILNRHFIS